MLAFTQSSQGCFTYIVNWTVFMCVCLWESMILCSLLVFPLPVFPNIPLSFIVAPVSSGTPRISRSNSIGPPTEPPCNLYGTSPLGSSLSLADRPKSMMRCGSFREQGDDGKSAWLPLLPAGGIHTMVWDLNKAVQSCSKQTARQHFRTWTSVESGEECCCLQL